MSFHNIVFDENYSQGSVGGPVYHTTIITYNNGFEQRNIDWSIPLSRWSVSHMMESDDKRRYLLSFFRARKGSGHTFLFKDWSDYRVRRTADWSALTYEEGVLTLISGTTYQMQKRYYDGVTNDYRDLIKIKTGTFILYNGASVVSSGSYTLDITTGQVTTAATFTHFVCEFYFVARFDFDEARIRLDLPSVGEWNDITVVEVRL